MSNHNSHDLPNRPLSVRSHILTKLAQIEGINCAALISDDGFLIERTSNEFDLSKLISLFDVRPNEIMLTIIGESSTIVGMKIKSGHILAVRCNEGSNLGLIRNELRASSQLLEDHV